MKEICEYSTLIPVNAWIILRDGKPYAKIHVMHNHDAYTTRVDVWLLHPTARQVMGCQTLAFQNRVTGGSAGDALEDAAHLFGVKAGAFKFCVSEEIDKPLLDAGFDVIRVI